MVWVKRFGNTNNVEVDDMWKSVSKVLATAVATAGLSILGTGAATAAETGQDYGQHVRTCAQTMGFDGTDNPGRMHQGFAGWNSSHVC